MEANGTTTAGGAGLLPEARHRLSGIAAGLGALQAETAWECRAADEYRADLGALIGQVRDLVGMGRELEADLRSVWARAAATGAW